MGAIRGIGVNGSTNELFCGCIRKVSGWIDRCYSERAVGKARGLETAKKYGSTFELASEEEGKRRITEQRKVGNERA